MRFSGLWSTLCLSLALILPTLLAAPALAVEEIVRVETRRIDCPTHPAGNMLCEQIIHQITTVNAGEPRAGKTFLVYTKDEIDARLKGLKAMAAEIERLQRALAEIAPVCAPLTLPSPQRGEGG
jgi:hypothetical protein